MLLMLVVFITRSKSECFGEQSLLVSRKVAAVNKDSETAQLR